MSNTVHVVTSNSAPTYAPSVVGQHYVNSTSGNHYLSVATTSVANWLQILPMPNTSLATMNANTIKGNNTGGATTPVDLTIAQTLTMLSLDLVTNTSDTTKFAPYHTVFTCTASHTAAQVAGTYSLTVGGQAAVVGGGSSAYPIALVTIAAADYPAVGALTAKLRIKCTISTNDVAPTGNFTWGLYPVTRPGTSGGIGVCIYTLGTVVSGSNGATVSAPAADLTSTLTGSDFALPADGTYAIAVVTTATIAALAHVEMNAVLQTRYT